MSECKLDHSVEDVRNKLKEQWEYLPQEIADDFNIFLNKELSQKTLNEAFHLLKKYDLSSKEEQEKRNVKMKELFKK